MAKQRKATIEHDEDGWWAYYSKGWKSGEDVVGIQHQDHADTYTELRELIKGAIKCNCVLCCIVA